MNPTLQQAAKAFAEKKDYDLKELIALMCREEEKEKIVPFVKKCYRSRRYATTCWTGYLKRNSATQNCLFKYNPDIIGKIANQKNLNTEESSELLIELAETGYQFLRKSILKNSWGGIEIDLEKLAQFNF